MIGKKQIGVLLSSMVLTVGLLAPSVSATVNTNETLPIQVAQKNIKVTKKDLINRLRELFPKDYTNITDKEFSFHTGYSDPGNTKLRYELYFSKEKNGKYTHGSFTFVGDELQLEQFYYQPKTSKDALFPAKYSKEEAQKIADKLLKQLNPNSSYQLDTTNYNYYTTVNLAEPVSYHFNYVNTKSDYKVASQSISINVLGDGTVTSYFKLFDQHKEYTYDDPAKIKSEKEIKTAYQNQLNAQLAYKIETDEHTGTSARLIYIPNTTNTFGIHALTGQWLTAEGMSTTIKPLVMEPIVSEPLTVEKVDLSVEDAQALAEKLLAIDKEGVTLNIYSIEETTTSTGKAAYTIHYQYEYKDGSSGTSLEIDKETGEIINFMNIKDALVEVKKDVSTPVLTQQQVVDKAIQYVKEWAPSVAHLYATPTMQYLNNENNGTYYLSLPRVENGLIVVGDYSYIQIDAVTGELLGLTVNAVDLDEWPESTNVIPSNDATEMFKNELKFELQYVMYPNIGSDAHNSLVYHPIFKYNMYDEIDASTGEWLDPNGQTLSEKPIIKHPTAEEELNYLIQTGILEVDKKFNPDASVTKEEAIKVLMKAFTYMDYYPQPDADTAEPAFKDIPADHKLYPYITQAVKIGTLEKSNGNFNGHGALTNQMLAKWSVGTLKLGKAAQYSDLYTLKFKDASKVKKEFRGYVALADALQLFEVKNNQFKPTDKVTYAQLAQITIRLAHKMHEHEIVTNN